MDINVVKYPFELENLAALLDVLSHPARLQILLHLSKYKSCPAGNISEQLPLSKSTVSQHMAKLKEAGLITCTPDGVCQKYRLNSEKFVIVKKYFNDFFELVEQKQHDRADCAYCEKSTGKSAIIKTKLMTEQH